MFEGTKLDYIRLSTTVQSASSAGFRHIGIDAAGVWLSFTVRHKPIHAVDMHVSVFNR